jgi:predicted kinase
VGESTAGVFVLVGGWPGSGKTTLSRGLAAELRLPLLAKDEVKEALADVLGRPHDVAGSQALGRAAVRALLRVALRCPSAVVDSTWFPEVRPLVQQLPGTLVEVRCVVDRELARRRYYSRAAGRHAGHLDLQRSEDELWGRPPAPLGVGRLVEVDTSAPVDVGRVAEQVMTAAGRGPAQPGGTSWARSYE